MLHYAIRSRANAANTPDMPRLSRSKPPVEDPYRVLGVPPDASLDAIKQAFRERALECHPDRAAAGEEAASADEFVRVRAAFDVLSDPKARRRYDAQRRHRQRRSGPQTNGAPRSNRSRTRSSRRPRRGASRNDAKTRRAAHRRQGGRFAQAWRDAETPNVWVGPMSDRVHGLSKRHDRLHQHHRRVVPVSAAAGAALFITHPRIIHTTGSGLIDLMLCIAISAACGFAISMILGILHTLVTDYRAG